ncbi:MAG: Gfo/Idh/MocA family protein, partial [Candidatus Aminicenantales bacterium]
MNFILVGCGRTARSYLEAIRFLPEVCLKEVVDISEEPSRSTARKAGCSSFTDFRSILRGNSVKAAVICTPPNTHPEITTFFLENGVHVLCEKPLAINSAQALEMLKKAKKHKRILIAASKFRCVEDIIRAKEIVNSGEIGKLIYFKNFFQSKVNMKNRWNSSKEVSGGGVLIDYGS